MYKIVKKDGSIEDFDGNKIVDAVVKAGGDEELAELVAADVEAWVATAADSEELPTSELRSKIISVLKSKNEKVAETFESYRKS